MIAIARDHKLVQDLLLHYYRKPEYVLAILSNTCATDCCNGEVREVSEDCAILGSEEEYVDGPDIL